MTVTGRKLTKGYLARVKSGSVVAVFPFQFNPTERTRNVGAEWVFEYPIGGSLPIARFAFTKGNQISFELLLDAVEGYDPDKLGVTAQMAELELMVNPDFERITEDIGQFIAPPQLRYGFGSDSWDVVMQELSLREVRWNRDGVCTRAYANIQLQANFIDLASMLDRIYFLSSYGALVERSEI